MPLLGIFFYPFVGAVIAILATLYTRTTYRLTTWLVGGLITPA